MNGTLGTAIRARRIELGLTQEELAARVEGGVRQSEISRLESGRVRLPRRERLESIAQALGVPMGELLERAGWHGAGAALSLPGWSPQAGQPNGSAPEARTSDRRC